MYSYGTFLNKNLKNVLQTLKKTAHGVEKGRLTERAGYKKGVAKGMAEEVFKVFRGDKNMRCFCPYITGLFLVAF